jgi:class 3 adenylate cyclase
VNEPETRYARLGDAHVAYQVFGDGPREIVATLGPASNIEIYWEQPRVVRYWERIGSFARVAIFDRRGTGLSDPLDESPVLEQQAHDMLAVADATGMEQPAVFGSSSATQMCAMFAATYPERASALVLFGAGGATLKPEARAAVLDEVEKGWGGARLLGLYSPSHAAEEDFRRWFGRYERHCVSPGMVRRLVDLSLQIDLTEVLGAIQAPTLVLHRTGDKFAPVEEGREMAKLIPGARFVELPGDDHLSYMGDWQGVLDEVEEFLTGVRHGPEPDRVLATVLFTDIVGSTEHAARLGDRGWRETLRLHEGVVERELARFRGRAVKSMGDGVLATFDGPARAIRCARALARSADALGLKLRAGIHTGEVELIGEDVGGIAVHIGARVSALAGADEVLVSSTVKDLVAGSGIEFDDRGEHALKGVPGEWRVYSARA